MNGKRALADAVFFIIIPLILVGFGVVFAEARSLYEPPSVPQDVTCSVEHNITPEPQEKAAQPLQALDMSESEDDDGSGMEYLGVYQIYGYDPTCSHCCGKSDGITASGRTAAVGRTVAMGGIPFGTEIYIDGLGRFIVEDRGVAGNVVDVACEDHAACYAITGKYDVYLLEG